VTRALSNNEGPPVLEEGGGQPAAPRPASKPYWIGLLVVAMGAVWLYGASSLPQGARYAAVGPGLFVTITGLGLAILGILLIVQVWRGERFEPQDAADVAASSSMDRRAFITAFVAVVLPVLIMQPLGLPLTATIAFVLVCRAFGSRNLLVDIVIGAILGSVAWFLFAQLGLQLGRFLPPLGF
jgi:putative tricarboxylic transport membrane protein